MRLRLWKCSRCGACCAFMACPRFSPPNICEIYQARPYPCRVPFLRKLLHPGKLEKSCQVLRFLVDLKVTKSCHL